MEKQAMAWKLYRWAVAQLARWQAIDFPERLNAELARAA